MLLPGRGTTDLVLRHVHWGRGITNFIFIVRSSAMRSIVNSIEKIEIFAPQIICEEEKKKKKRTKKTEEEEEEERRKMASIAEDKKRTEVKDVVSDSDSDDSDSDDGLIALQWMKKKAVNGEEQNASADESNDSGKEEDEEEEEEEEEEESGNSEIRAASSRISNAFLKEDFDAYMKAEMAAREQDGSKEQLAKVSNKEQNVHSNEWLQRLEKCALSSVTHPRVKIIFSEEKEAASSTDSQRLAAAQLALWLVEGSYIEILSSKDVVEGIFKGNKLRLDKGPGLWKMHIEPLLNWEKMPQVLSGREREAFYADTLSRS